MTRVSPSNAFRIAEFARRVGMSPTGIRQMERDGRWSGGTRTPSGHRLYTEDDVRSFMGIPERDEAKVIVYCRVSSRKQSRELEHQVQAMEQFCLARGVAVDEWITEIGGGLNMHRPQFADLVWRIANREVSTLLVAHKDRLCRFGFGLIEEIAERAGATIVVANQESLSPEQEVVEDVLAVLQHFSARVSGLRSYSRMATNELGSSNSSADPKDAE